MKLSTKALHSGHDVQKTEGTRAVPIYQSTSYKFNDTKHASNLFNLNEEGYIYTRLNNPTNDILEKRLADLEGGIGGVVFASGTSAISTGLLTILKSGDHIVASNNLYGGTFNLLKIMLPRFGINTTFVDPNNIDNFKKEIKENTKVIFVESIGNPKLDILDIESISKVSQEARIPLIVDNTLLTPALFKPLDYGANIVMYSLTKFMAGQGNSLGGAIIDGGNFNWENGKFPEFTEPSESYNGMIYTKALEKAAYIGKVRLEGLRDLGGALSPFNSFQIIQGIETLDIRMKKHSENALELAKWLEVQEEVEWVNYPGLENHLTYKNTKKYIPKGQSGVLTFGLKGGFESAKKLVDNVKLITLLANIGDSKSLIIHPGSTTHQQLTEEERLSTGVSNDLIRLSVGLEDIEDIKEDLKQSFAKI